MKRRTFLQATGAAMSAQILSAIAEAANQGIPAPSANDPEYIVVGSGPGGGPVAANLARAGHSVLLIEAGLDNMTGSIDYEVPLLSAASAPEDPRLEWAYFVNHYSNLARQEQDSKMQYDSHGNPLGIFYPRAATLGGCASHNFLIAIKPVESDWDYIAEVTGDKSWSSANMTQYWERVERNAYGPFMVPGPEHGYNGWLGTQVFDPNYILTHDPLLVKNLLAAALQFPSPWSTADLMAALDTPPNFTAFVSTNPNKPGLLTRDLNSGDPGRDEREGLFSVVLSTYPNAALNSNKPDARSGPREFIAQTVSQGYPLTVKTGALATQVLFEKDGGNLTAVAVQYLNATHIYQADPNAVPPPTVVNTVRAQREIILAGGTFNTPQLLKLSGIGPAAELKSLGIPVLVDLPGVGLNLQDRYEIGVVAVTNQNYSIFTTPNKTEACYFGASGDPCMAVWNAGQEGIYNTSGTMGVVVKRSNYAADADPDLFMYAAPYNFTGYYRGYTNPANLTPDYRHFTWGVLKAHTRNTAGTVTLKSANPLEPPQIDFHYFDEGTTAGGAAQLDLEAVADGIEFVRSVIAKTNQLMGPGGFTEIYPGTSAATTAFPTQFPNGVQTRDQIKQYIQDEAWGHHACGTSKMGADNDPMAVVDSCFRVRGTNGLRVVDASVFPEIPGYFIVVPIYILSEKASDVILEDLKKHFRNRPARGHILGHSR
jgi:choline dehydrogenase